MSLKYNGNIVQLVGMIDSVNKRDGTLQLCIPATCSDERVCKSAGALEQVDKYVSTLYPRYASPRHGELYRIKLKRKQYIYLDDQNKLVDLTQSSKKTMACDCRIFIFSFESTSGDICGWRLELLKVNWCT
jgi:hypothetical protein